MRIAPIQLFNTFTKFQNNNSIYSTNIIPQYNNQLTQDTVSFGAAKKKKKANIPTEEIDHKNKEGEKNHKNAIPIGLAIQLREEAQPTARELHAVLKQYLSPLVADLNHPDRPILPGERGIHGRVKDENSIAEKSISCKLKTKKEMKANMQDIIGERIVLRDASKKSVDLVIKQLIKAIKNGALNVVQIENYRTTPNESYPSPASLKALSTACNKVREVACRECAIPSGYTALHLTVQLKDGFFAEIQLMGADVEQVKEIEDLIYKVKFKKQIKSKYKERIVDADTPSIYEHIKSLEDNEPLQRAVNAYTRTLYSNARAMEPRSAKSKAKVKFAEAPDYLSQDFDFNLLYRLKCEADKKAAILARTADKKPKGRNQKQEDAVVDAAKKLAQTEEEVKIAVGRNAKMLKRLEQAERDAAIQSGKAPSENLEIYEGLLDVLTGKPSIEENDELIDDLNDNSSKE